MTLFPAYHGGALLDAITSTENMVLAWRRVERNIQLRRRGRSAGIDAVTLRDFQADLARQLDSLVDELRSGRYRPLPSVRVAIPKRDGGARAIAILAVRDRVVQRAVQQVLEPLFDPYFLDCSFGCRPRVGVVDAIRRVERYAEQGLIWVVDADIATYFDAIDQRLLLGLIRQRVPDVHVLRLIARLLEANTSTDAEDAPLVPPDPPGRRWLRRGEQLLRQTLGGEPAHLPPGPLPDLADYAADSWEDPAGIGANGWPGMPAHPFDRPPVGASSLLNLLWSAYLMGRPLQGVAAGLAPGPTDRRAAAVGGRNRSGGSGRTGRDGGALAADGAARHAPRWRTIAVAGEHLSPSLRRGIDQPGRAARALYG